MSVCTIGIIGAGVAGSGIAQLSVTAGFDVILVDISDDAVTKSIATIAGNLARLVAKSKISATERDAALARITRSVAFEALGPADLVIEATPENFELKSNVLKRIDPLIRPDTIVASATSSLSITKLASALSHPDRFVGMQFFHPVPVMALVEIVRGLQTSDATRDAVETLSMKLGKAPVTVRNGSCSVISRILSLMVNEAFFVLAEGNADPSEIDEGMKLGCNHPIGPLALADLIGLDVLLSVMQSIHDELGDFEIPPGASPQGDGRRGISRRKSGRGVYRY